MLKEDIFNVFNTFLISSLCFCRMKTSKLKKISKIKSQLIRIQMQMVTLSKSYPPSIINIQTKVVKSLFKPGLEIKYGSSQKLKQRVTIHTGMVCIVYSESVGYTGTCNSSLYSISHCLLYNNCKYWRCKFRTKKVIFIVQSIVLYFYTYAKLITTNISKTEVQNWCMTWFSDKSSCCTEMCFYPFWLEKRCLRLIKIQEYCVILRFA